MDRTTTVMLVLAALLAGAPVVGSASLDWFQGCWKTTTLNEDTENSISFCVEGDSVEVSIFYPNRGPNSTTCNSTGSIELIDSTRLMIRTHPGYCENGRTLGVANLDCTVLNRNELSCLHPNSEYIHLWRADALDNNDS